MRRRVSLIGMTCLLMGVGSVLAMERTGGDEAQRQDQAQPLIPVTVTAQTDAAVIEEGEPIPVTVTIRNGLPAPIRYTHFGLEPNEHNGETMSLTLMDIYRDGEERGRFLQRPRFDQPMDVAGPASTPIASRQSLSIRTDARKWTIRGDWAPGQYRATVRVNNISADGNRVNLGVSSEPFEFEIR